MRKSCTTARSERAGPGRVAEIANARSSSTRGSEQGLTLVEVVVATAVITGLTIAVYSLLDASNRLAKQETNVAAAQQGSRTSLFEVARVVRQARSLQLFYGNAILPIANNSPGGESFLDLSGQPHYVRKGTDVIGVRGVLLGDRYSVTGGDVTCGSLLCSVDAPMTITIRSTAKNGVVNYPSGSLPDISTRTRPFYFGVLFGTLQTVRISNTDFLIPLYYVGLVDTTGAWFTQTSDTFTFTMDPRDSGARKLNAVLGTVRELVQSPYSCGPVDEVLFFVDEGSSNASASLEDTHPSLAEAIFDPSSGRYDVQPIVDEVEDFQVAYGVDGVDGSAPDRGIAPTRLDTSAANRDEWVGNVSGEVENTLTFSTTEPHFVDAFVDRAVAPGVPDLFTRAVPALRSVWLSIVVKAQDPDLKYAGPGALGVQLLDSTALSFSSSLSTGRPYRRRATSLAVSLRNFQ